jgi:hypothetical protein
MCQEALPCMTLCNSNSLVVARPTAVSANAAQDQKTGPRPWPGACPGSFTRMLECTGAAAGFDTAAGAAIAAFHHHHTL